MTTLGFIGLGVMGEPMCRNLAQKSGVRVIAHDLAAAPLERLAAQGVEACDGPAAMSDQADLIFLSLPSGAHVEGICRGERGLAALARPGQTVVDLGTSPPHLARDLEAEFAAQGASFADAPVARTRQAAEQGTLSVMVGAAPEVFARIRPYLACFASDIAHCGPSGAGQVVKILNNMVLFQTISALSEARALAIAAGVDVETLFDALSNGSADSFALRSHGMKAVAPQAFPAQAFSTAYALKDLRYALEMGAEARLDMPGARVVEQLFEAAIKQGLGDHYWPVISTLVRPDAD
jgi:3-hydroxyisobutyrate dehydrogenase-like beta-hydroxyacid dehydrogenase